jgi:hypothetical protein
VVCPLPDLEQLPPLEISMIDVVNMNAVDLVDAEDDADPRIEPVKALRILEKHKLKRVLPFENLPHSLRLLLSIELGVESNQEFFDLQLEHKPNEELWSPCCWYLGRCGGCAQQKRLRGLPCLPRRST